MKTSKTEELATIKERYIRCEFKDAGDGYFFSLDMEGVSEQHISAAIGYMLESMSPDAVSSISGLADRIYAAKIKELTSGTIH